MNIQVLMSSFFFFLQVKVSKKSYWSFNIRFVVFHKQKFGCFSEVLPGSSVKRTISFLQKRIQEVWSTNFGIKDGIDKVQTIF